MSQKRDGFETVRKAVPVASLFLSYMDPRCRVSRGKTKQADSGKRDYQYRARIGCVEKREVAPWCFCDPDMQDCLSVDYVKPVILTISAIPCATVVTQLFKPGAKPYLYLRSIFWHLYLKGFRTMISDGTSPMDGF